MVNSLQWIGPKRMPSSLILSSSLTLSIVVVFQSQWLLTEYTDLSPSPLPPLPLPSRLEFCNQRMHFGLCLASPSASPIPCFLCWYYFHLVVICICRAFVLRFIGFVSEKALYTTLWHIVKLFPQSSSLSWLCSRFISTRYYFLNYYKHTFIDSNIHFPGSISTVSFCIYLMREWNWISFSATPNF